MESKVKRQLISVILQAQNYQPIQVDSVNEFVRGMSRVKIYTTAISITLIAIAINFFYSNTPSIERLSVPLFAIVITVNLFLILMVNNYLKIRVKHRLGIMESDISLEKSDTQSIHNDDIELVDYLSKIDPELNDAFTRIRSFRGGHLINADLKLMRINEICELLEKVYGQPNTN